MPLRSACWSTSLAYVIGSLTRAPKPLERLQAGVFIRRKSRTEKAFRGRKTKITVLDLKTTIARYLGEERMQRSFQTYERQSAAGWRTTSRPTWRLIHFSEQLLGSAIGSSSARLVLSLVLQRMDDTSSDTAWLLDQASEALQYNQDMLQTALSQMDQGIAVFDSSNNLIIWNRRFRQLLDLPESAGQVGFPLAEIVSMLTKRGDIRKEDGKRLIANFLTLDKPFLLELSGGERIIEVRTNAMPDKGIVTTYTDITQRVAADMALKQANETLELRVAERTGELTRVNKEVAEARAAAEEANIGKTRFFAAAGHDILQPLNAARLYSSSLVERLGDSENSVLVQNIDSSLESVETILGAVLDISRLDTGAMKPRLQSVPLNDLLRRIETDFAPVARAANLKLTVMPTSLTVRTDPNLLRRLVQNLVSNAIKYTLTGKVLVGVRREGGNAVIQVLDSGIGIPVVEIPHRLQGIRPPRRGRQDRLRPRARPVDRRPHLARPQPHRRPAIQARQGHALPGDACRSTARPPAASRPLPRSRSAPPNRCTACACSASTTSPDPRRHEAAAGGLGLHGFDHAVAATSGSKIRPTRDLRPDAIIADYHLDKATGIDMIRAIRAAFRRRHPRRCSSPPTAPPKSAPAPNGTVSPCKTNPSAPPRCEPG